MKNRSEAREAVLRILYKLEILESAKVESDIEEIMREECPVQNEFIENLVHGIIAQKKELDEMADKYLKSWTISRFNKVDQTIFRIGLYELLETDTPSIVSINEAVELSKKYSDEAITKMLNAVLDSVFHSEEDKRSNA